MSKEKGAVKGSNGSAGKEDVLINSEWTLKVKKRSKDLNNLSSVRLNGVLFDRLCFLAHEGGFSVDEFVVLLLEAALKPKVFA
jgi:hypothetical protein